MKNVSIPCPQEPVQPPTLFIPQPNATGVPDQINGIEVTYDLDIGIWSAPVLMPANGGAAGGYDLQRQADYPTERWNL